jgi:DNA-binding GntR family transcriptional regulator
MQPKSSNAGAPPLPIYLAIRNAIRDAISQGAYAPGDLLPSETELAKRFATTRATVVHAVQQLVFEGLVERRRGVGSFVANSKLETTVDTRRIGYFEQDVFDSGIDLSYKIISFGKTAVDDHVRQELDVGPDEPIYRLQRLRLLSGKPIAFEIRFMPALIAGRLTGDMLAGHSLQTLLEQLGMPISKFLNTVRVALVPADVAKHLKIDRTRPVMVRSHTFLDAKGHPMLWGETLYREEYKIHYVLQAQDNRT